MPMYLFRRGEAGEPESLGFFNDDGALKYASRIAGRHEVQVTEGDRLVGRVPAQPLPVLVNSG